jgi:hypothetical protein
VYRPTLSAALLVLLVLPTSSLTTVCDLNCQRGALPGMAMSSPGFRQAVHDPSSGRPLHHHASGHSQHSARGADVATVVENGQVSPNHQCCHNSRVAVSSPCAASRLIESQAQTATPKVGYKPLLVQGKAPALAFTIQAVNQNPAGENVARGPAPHSLTLRI